MATSLAIPARAQGMNNKEVVANVAFEFYVGETSFPAGWYNISARDIGAETVMIRASSGKEATSIPVVTRLARLGGGAQTGKSNLVFDKVGDRSYLSEVWIPGREGYLVRSTSDAHQHVVVTPGK